MKKNYIHILTLALGLITFPLTITPLDVSKLVTTENTQSELEKKIEIINREIAEIQALDVSNDLQEYTAQLQVLNQPNPSNNQSEATNEFIAQKRSITNQIVQDLTEIEKTRQETIEMLNKHKQMLKKPYNNGKEDTKAAPGYDDLQTLANQILRLRAQKTELQKNIKNVTNDTQKRKKALASAQDELKEKKREQDAFPPEEKIFDQRFSVAQEGQLLDLVVKQMEYRKQLAQLKVTESELRYSFIETKASYTKKQLEFLQQRYTDIKQALKIDQSYVQDAKKKLDQELQQSTKKQEKLYEQIKKITALEQNISQQVREGARKSALTTEEQAQIQEWQKEPVTQKDWRTVSQLGLLFEQRRLMGAEKDLLESQLDLEKATMRQKEVQFNIISSWYKMTQGIFKAENDEEIEQELRNYENLKTELQADAFSLGEKRDQTINTLHKLNMELDRVKELVTKLQQSGQQLFKGRTQELQKIIMTLYQSEEKISKRITIATRLAQTYATTLVYANNSLKAIDEIMQELRTKSFWRRSNLSIEWHEVKNFVPNIEKFLRRISRRTSKALMYISTGSFIKDIKPLTATPITIILNLLRLIIACVAFLLIRIYLPSIARFFNSIESRYKVIMKLSAFCAIVVEFVNAHLVSLYIWACFLVLIKFDFITNTHFAILFYLLSIPYLLFMAYKFVHYFDTVNKKRGHLFFDEHYTKRFMLVMPLLLYATIIIVFFRQAFVLDNPNNSQVPTILLALNFILLQIAAIGLIGKEEVLAFISRKGKTWEWIKEKIDNYYYIFLLCIIAIIVMSNPYVGYGRQVLYIVSRSILTLLLIPLVSWLYAKTKRISSDMFFYYSESGTVKERFALGKTWYGLFVVVSFLLFIVLGIFVIAKVWDQGFALENLRYWFSDYSLYSPGLNEVTGQPIQVTVSSLFKIILFVIGGIVATYIINHFVLKRIFDPLLIGSGVQNTILTLTRYVIVVMMLLIGLQSAGLGALTTKLAVLIGIVGFAIQKPLGDFFSYFIILVQRPIKIGDLIKMEDNGVFGVVRQITPRSTIVRHKNSVTLVVPNSEIINKVVRNWSYNRTFGAFSDMLVTVPYTADPEQVKKLILEVFDENNNVLRNPAPVIWLNDFTEIGFQFLLRGYLSADKILDQWDIASQIRFGVVKKLRENGINIATPIRTLTIKSNAKENVFTEQITQTPDIPDQE